MAKQRKEQESKSKRTESSHQNMLARPTRFIRHLFSDASIYLYYWIMRPLQQSPDVFSLMSILLFANMEAQIIQRSGLVHYKLVILTGYIYVYSKNTKIKWAIYFSSAMDFRLIHSVD